MFAPDSDCSFSIDFAQPHGDDLVKGRQPSLPDSDSL